MVTDPSKERIAAALALAEVLVEYDEKIRKFVDWDPMLAKVLEAYRATLPRIRARAEVDALKLELAGRFYRKECDHVWFRQEYAALCAEPTAEDSGSGSAPAAKESTDNAEATVGAANDEPEACSCDEALELRRLLRHMRSLAEEMVRVTETTPG